MLSKIAFSLTIGAKLMALSSSNPVTLSAPDQEMIGDSKIIANARGDFVLYWKLSDLEGDKVQVAVKPKDGGWLPFTTVAQDEGVSVKECILDDSGNIDIFLLKGCCGNKTLHGANKKWGEPWSRISNFSQTANTISYGEYLVYKKNMFVSLSKSKNNYVDRLFFAFYDKENDKIFHKSLATAWSLYSSNTYLNKQRTICAVWEKRARIAGWFSTEDKYSLEAAWMREGTSTPALETICTLDKKTWLSFSNMDMAIDPQENATIVWTWDGKIQAVSRAQGKWNVPVDVSSSAKNLVQLKVSCDDEGNALVVWCDKAEKRGTLWSAYKPLGGSWTAPVEISALSGNNKFFTVAHTHAGQFVVVWNYGIKLMMDSIYGATFSTKDQKWSAPQRLSPDGQICQNPSLAFSESGKGYLNWINITNPKDVKVQVAELRVD